MNRKTGKHKVGDFDNCKPPHINESCEWKKCNYRTIKNIKNTLLG